MRARRAAEGATPGAGAPFYAPPPRRKTSAEIISEARAALFGERGSGSGQSGASLRALPTRRPFTPRDAQRTLFAARNKRDNRPPSAFNLKYLAEGGVASIAAAGEPTAAGGGSGAARGVKVASLDEDSLRGLLLTETQAQRRKQIRKKALSLQVEEPPRGVSTAHASATTATSAGDGSGWGSNFPKLPNLSGHSKPLHRRKHASLIQSRAEELSTAIFVTQPLGSGSSSTSHSTAAGPAAAAGELESEGAASRRRQFSGHKSRSDEQETKKKDEEPRCSSAQLRTSSAVAVTRLAVQLPAAGKLRHAAAAAVLHHTDLYEINPYRYSVAELVEELSRKDPHKERVSRVLDALYATLEAAGGCECVSRPIQESVLRALYCHVDSEDERTLVGIARIMLAMRVTGGNLSAACKLIFKVARNDKNDHLFKTTNVLELLVCGCGRACPLTEGECCVYGAGALRFLALEPSLRALAVSAGALHLAALHLKIINNAKSERSRSVTDQTSHALYQLTGAVRNLASGDQLHEFVSCGLLQELTLSLFLFITDRDIVTNVTRTLSVVSTDAECCAWLSASASSARALVRALCACASHSPLAVRLAYTLGNMAAASETARINIYSEPGAVDVLLTVLETQLLAREGPPARRDNGTEDPDTYLVGSDLAGSDGSCDDVLVKTVRVLANLCLAERAGRGLAATHAERTLKALLACCARTQHQPMEVEEEEDAETSDELATAALATINNLTFYHEVAASADVDPFHSHLDQLCRVSCEFVSAGARGVRVRAACEAVRALGNVTRAPRAALLAVRSGVLDALEPFLQHEDVGVRCGAAGVLVNVCGASGADGAGGAAAARGLALAARAQDTHAAALLARALWNAHAHRPLSPERAAEAAHALAELMDDDSVFASCEEEMVETSAAAAAAAAHRDLKQVKFSQPAPAPVRTETDIERASDLAHSPRHVYCDGYADGNEDLGYSEDFAHDTSGGCECAACARLAAWEELMGVAIPLLEKLRPHRADANVGTD